MENKVERKGKRGVGRERREGERNYSSMDTSSIK